MLPKITSSDLFSHPDKNPDDPLAHEKFRDISDAYEVCFLHKFGVSKFFAQMAEGPRKGRGQRGPEREEGRGAQKGERVEGPRNGRGQRCPERAEGRGGQKGESQTFQYLLIFLNI